MPKKIKWLLIMIVLGSAAIADVVNFTGSTGKEDEGDGSRPNCTYSQGGCWG